LTFADILAQRDDSSIDGTRMNPQYPTRVAHPKAIHLRLSVTINPCVVIAQVSVPFHRSNARGSDTFALRVLELAETGALMTMAGLLWPVGVDLLSGWLQIRSVPWWWLLLAAPAVWVLAIAMLETGACIAYTSIQVYPEAEIVLARSDRERPLSRSGLSRSSSCAQRDLMILMNPHERNASRNDIDWQNQSSGMWAFSEGMK